MEKSSKAGHARHCYVAPWVKTNWLAAPAAPQGLEIRWAVKGEVGRHVIPIHALDPTR